MISVYLCNNACIQSVNYCINIQKGRIMNNVKLKIEYSVNSFYPSKEMFIEFCTEKQKKILIMFDNLFTPDDDAGIEQRLFIGLSSHNTENKYKLHITVMNTYAPDKENKVLFIENTLELDGYRSNFITYFRNTLNNDTIHQHQTHLYVNPYGMPSIPVLKKLIARL